MALNKGPWHFETPHQRQASNGSKKPQQQDSA
jgi:hypothetical protein